MTLELWETSEVLIKANVTRPNLSKDLSSLQASLQEALLGS